MASAEELIDIARRNGEFKRRVLVECVVVCDAIRLADPAPPNQQARLAWARRTLDDPSAAADAMVWAVLAQNRTRTVQQITGVSDGDLNAAVLRAVDLLAI